MRIVFLAILGLTLLIAPSYGQNPPSGSAKLYAVVFGFVIDENGKLKSFRVLKVIDPLAGSADAVNVRVPETYVAAARAQLMSKGHEATAEHGKLKEAFTYFFFDPRRPTRADIDPQAGKQ